MPQRAADVVYGLVFVLACALVARTLVLIYAMARPVPYWDAWEFMKALPALTEGRYTLANLFAFHNEHRIVTTRLVMMADLRLADASGSLSTALIAALFCAIGVGLARFAIARGWARACAAALAAALLLSVAQADNFASGFQVQFPLVDLFAAATIGFFALSTRGGWPAWPLLAAAVAADGLAIGSMASGNTLVGPVLLVAVLLRAPLIRTLAFAGPALAMSAAYAVDFPKPDVAPSRDPVGIAHFAVNALGSTLRGYAGASLLLGAGLILTYAIVLAAAARSWSRRDRVDLSTAWLVGIAAFAVVGALVTGAGRLSLGLETSIASRYAAQSLLFACCVILLAWRSAGSGPAGSWARPALAVAWLGLAAGSTLAAKPMAEWRSRVAAYDAAGAAFSSGVFSDGAITGVYPWPDLVRPTLGFMAQHRLGPFSDRYASIYRPPVNTMVGVEFRALPACVGAANDWVASGPGWLDLDGWVMGSAAQADRVGWLMAYDAGGRLLGFTRASIDRPDVAAALAVPSSHSGYHLALDARGVEPSALRSITAVFTPDGTSEGRCAAAMPTP